MFGQNLDVQLSSEKEKRKENKSQQAAAVRWEADTRRLKAAFQRKDAAGPSLYLEPGSEIP